MQAGFEPCTSESEAPIKPNEPSELANTDGFFRFQKHRPSTVNMGSVSLSEMYVSPL